MKTDSAASSPVTNIVVAGLGGQGVITCSDILAQAALGAGFDVKKAEIHGMSQRGGSVTTDVRFGKTVYSPMVTRGEAQFLLALCPTQIPVNAHYLAPGGVILQPSDVPAGSLANPRTLNTALLGRLSTSLAIDEQFWLAAIERFVPSRYLEQNVSAFRLGQTSKDNGA